MRIPFVHQFSGRLAVARAIAGLLAPSLAVALAACSPPPATSQPAPAQASPPVQSPAAPAEAAREQVNAVAWTQTSAEYHAVAIAAYRTARLRLDEALRDPAWTALDVDPASLAGKPPAVVLDLDETVLDNTPFQAWLVQTGQRFSGAAWTRWCLAEEAPAVPGAVDFLRHAAARGVDVFYVTNRNAEVRDATVADLARLGIAPADPLVNLLMQGDPIDAGGEKTKRRARVAETHRVLLLVGDNLADFVDEARDGFRARARFAEDSPWRERWGREWIMIPNPMYGSWESALWDYERGLSQEDRDRRKREALKAWRPAGESADRPQPGGAR